MGLITVPAEFRLYAVEIGGDPARGDGFQSCGDRVQEAATLRRLGAVLLDAGTVPEGCAAWRRAAMILGDLGHPDADVVLRQLGQVTTRPLVEPGHRAGRSR